ncbi:hypothetical protein [Terriglobus sp. RCC_193]|uniref:hypothetical protein n=1 Tax=Terriglobus sp. RCC_193 TaxID=3239218 RepID=UPI003523CBD2
METQQKHEQVGVTTVETNDHRHLVEPYKERPTIELKQGVVACPFCGNPQFRRSRLRFSDLLEILMLRYPVRCTRCAQRQFTDIYVAMMSYPPKHHGGRSAQDETSWKNWTGPSTTVQTARPLSTAMEPKARNLERISETHRISKVHNVFPQSSTEEHEEEGPA